MLIRLIDVIMVLDIEEGDDDILEKEVEVEYVEAVIDLEKLAIVQKVEDNGTPNWFYDNGARSLIKCEGEWIYLKNEYKELVETWKNYINQKDSKLYFYEN